MFEKDRLPLLYMCKSTIFSGINERLIVLGNSQTTLPSLSSAQKYLSSHIIPSWYFWGLEIYCLTANIFGSLNSFLKIEKICLESRGL